jgi:hypothetical protein
MQHIQESGEIHTGFWWENHLQDLGTNGRAILKHTLEKQNGRVRIG